MSKIYPPFTEDYRFTGPHTAISCVVNYDKEKHEYHAIGNNGQFHGTADTADGAALNCFQAWMTSNRGWFESNNN